MHQIKFFKAVESDLDALQDEMNGWLKETGAEVVQVLGNIAPQTVPAGQSSSGMTKSAFAPSDVLFAVVYKA